ncbi:MAG: polyprenyl synthetase family protein [Candidatus Omnitrophica bacterium]|nr:polyprenyl synthetase family protein [Candidatus Omnitrophota bacterium]
MASGGGRLSQILEPVQEDLGRVTDRLMACLQNPVARMAAYLITAGGKRLRPALVLLAGRSGEARQHRRALVDLATAVELIHTATLIHDDIIDESVLRRRQPTFHSRFGTERAVLMGDYLYATAFAILAELHDAQVTSAMAEVCQQMSRGEFLEVKHRFNLTMTEEDYFRIIRDKTAALIAACCRLGAQVAGAKPQTVKQVSEFGWNFGMAFQIMDDCLDLIGEEAVVGKDLQADLDNGLLSLPIIYLANALPRRSRDTFFAPLLQTRTAPRGFLSRVAREARRRGAVTQARQAAETFMRQATEAVAVRNGIVLTETYRQLARYAIERDR